MEHPSKRRRVERPIDNYATVKDVQEEIELSLSEQDGIRGVPKLVLPPSGDKAFDIASSSRQEADPPFEPLDLSRLPVPKLEHRQVLAPVDSVAGQATGVVGGATPPVASAVNGATNGAVKVASSPSQPPVNNAASSEPTPTHPGYVQPPAAVAAQDARNSALASEQAQAKEDDRLPPPPASSPTANEAPNPAVGASTPAAQNSMSIQVPGSGLSSEQQVLSSPPTPLPATPEASANPSTSSSYFSSSPASAVITASSGFSASPSTGVPALAKSTSNNSTMSSESMTGSVTSSVSNTMNSASSSIDAALLAAMSASRASLSSLEAMSSSVTGSDFLSASGSQTGSSASLTTMMTMTSSLGTIQSASATGSGAASTGAGAGGIGGATSTAGAPTSTSSATSGSGGGNNKPATPALIGGIVGGISGLVLILLAALLLLRWKKGNLGSRGRRTISPPMLQTSGTGAASQSGTGTTGTGTTGTQRSSTAPIAAAGLFGRLRPSSSQTATTADTAPSERGFQKISGRKLPSVLTSGGDGYGEKAVAGAAGAAVGAGAGAVAASKDAPPMPQQKGVAPGQGPFAGLAPALRPSPPHSLSGSSFYRDSRGFYGGVVPESTSGSGATEPSGSPTSSSPTFPSPLAIAGGAKDPGTPSRKPTMRPGPARTPVISAPGAVPPPRPVRGTPPPTGAQDPRDLLGRSHPSEDGSRASRFRESTTPP